MATATSSSSSGKPEELSLDITLAEVACDGTVHVEYETVALPPGWTADHIVMVNPIAGPTAIQAETATVASGNR